MQPDRISQPILDVILDQEGGCYISVISAWEYGQKRKLKPEVFPVPFNILLAQMPHQKLNLDFALSPYAESLPLIHRDPFDRLLIAQALHHDLTLITSDKEIRKYPVPTIW